MKWEKVNINSVLPEEITETVKSANKNISNIKTISNALKPLISLISSAALSTIDPSKSIIDVLLDELQGIADAFFNSGVHVMYVDSLSNGGTVFGSEITERPDTAELALIAKTPEDRDSLLDQLTLNRISKTLLTPSEALQVINSSLYDLGDDQRPKLNENSDVATLNIVVTAASITELVEKVTFIADFFSLRGIKDRLGSFENLDKQYDFTISDSDMDIATNSIRVSEGVFNSVSPKGRRVSFSTIQGRMISGLNRFFTYYIAPFGTDRIRIFRNYESLVGEQPLVLKQPSETSSWGVRILDSYGIGTTPGSVPPDWRSKKLSDLSGISHISRSLSSMIDSLRSTVANSDDSVSGLVRVIDEKISSYQRMLDNLQDAFLVVERMATMTGVYLLYADSLGDSNKGYSFLNEVYSTYQVEGEDENTLDDEYLGQTAVLSLVASTADSGTSLESIRILYQFIGG